MSRATLKPLNPSFEINFKPQYKGKLTAFVAGPRGPEGRSGPVVVPAVAGQVTSGHRVMAVGADGRFVYAGSNHEDRLPVGISLGAAAENAALQVQAGGEIVEPSWSWDVQTPVYMGVDGLLTQTPPSVGMFVIVGKPVSPTSMIISFSEPFIVE